jgi:hypothetical protein
MVQVGWCTIGEFLRIMETENVERNAVDMFQSKVEICCLLRCVIRVQSDTHLPVPASIFRVEDGNFLYNTSRKLLSISTIDYASWNLLLTQDVS